MTLMPRHFRHRLALLFGVLALIIGLPSTFLITQVYHDRLIADRGQTIQDLSRAVAAVVGENLRERLREIELLAHSSLFRRQPLGSAEIGDSLTRAQATYPSYSWIGLADVEGRVRNATGNLLLGAEVTQRPWFQGGLSGPFLGDVHEALLLSKLLPPSPDGRVIRFIDFAAPVRDDQGQLRGVLGAHAHWDWANTVIQVLQPAQAAAEGLEIFIVNHQGQIIYPDDSGPVAGPGARDGTSQGAGAASPPGVSVAPPRPTRIPSGLTPDQPFIEDTWDGVVPYLSALSPVPQITPDRPLGWSIAVRQPLAQALAEVEGLQAGMMLLAGLAVLIFAALAWWSAARFSRPLEHLVAVARRIERGEREIPLANTASAAEFQALDEALHAMASTLIRQRRELERVNLGLEAEVARRTAEAEAASAAKSEFLAHMSHEIRTPMNAVLGLAQLLGRERLSTDQAAMVRRIQTAGQSLLGIINDILDFSKIEAGQLPIEYRPFSLPSLQAKLDSLLAPGARAKGLTLSIHSPPGEVGPLLGDALRLEQVLINLIGNALKFTEAGEVSLTITRLDRAEVSIHDPAAADRRVATPHEPATPDRVEAPGADPATPDRVEAPGADPATPDRAEAAIREPAIPARVEADAHDPAILYLRFRVQDSGIGIAPAVLARLFTPFTQADASTTRRFGGTGLGLAISKRLVELMGGAIGAASHPGRGSAFWFELPFQRAPADASEASAAPAPALPAGPRLRGLHVLAVDDSPLNRDLVERALTREGARVTLAADGQQAIQWLETRAQEVDAVLMDVQMPVMDGLTAMRHIRDELGLSELPVLALTAGVFGEQQAAARAAGADDVLAKPLDLDQLVNRLRDRVGPEAMARAEARAEAQARPRESEDTDAGTRAAPREARAAPRAGVTHGDFPLIEGIDRVRAALSVDQDRDFFLLLLGRFLADARDAVPEIRAWLAQGDRETATRRVHSLRGNAGNIGALGIMTLAAGLEEALRRAGRADEADLDRLERQLNDLAAASAPWLQAAAASGPWLQAAAVGAQAHPPMPALNVAKQSPSEGDAGIQPPRPTPVLDAGNRPNQPPPDREVPNQAPPPHPIGWPPRPWIRTVWKPCAAPWSGTTWPPSTTMKTWPPP